MTEDNFTNRWQYLFFFTKAARYHFDLDSARTPQDVASIRRQLSPPKNRGEQRQFAKQGLHDYINPLGKNPGDYWELPDDEPTSKGETPVTNSLVICGHTLDILAGMKEESVDTIITSPPYWGLRSYSGTETQWSDGWYGQLGLEPDPELWLLHMWQIFDECRRVLKKTGCCFVNLGDSYSGAGRNAHYPGTGGEVPATPNHSAPNIPAKCLLMLPERFAIGMIERGWWLRNKIIFSKKNPMPESCRDRFSTTHEYVYFFTRAAKYAFDLDSVRERQAETTKTRAKYSNRPSRNWKKTILQRWAAKDLELHPAGKNPGDVWRIPTQPFPEAHFATFPEALLLKPIRAGCPQKCCKECGAPYVRVTEKGELIDHPDRADRKVKAVQFSQAENEYKPGGTLGKIQQSKTIGWEPTCSCNRGTEPGLVLDPFLGSGTTLLVAVKEGRRGIGIEISEDYCRMSRKRIAGAQAPLTFE